MKSQTATGSVFGAVLLIAGTSIGGGMIGMPVVTGLGGFLPSIALTVVVWLCMLGTGFLYLEATLSMPDGTNVASIAEKYLGKGGKVVCGLAFLFVYACLMVAYYAGAAPLVQQAFPALPTIWSYFLIAGVFGTIVFLGTHVADWLNWLLMGLLFATFLFILYLGASHVTREHLVRKNWTFVFLAAPILFTSFGYHNIVPSMATYLKRDVRKLKWALIWGTALPLVVYLLWQWFTLGSIPLGDLWIAYESGSPITESFALFSATPWLGRLATFFSFFALVTSLLGISISLVDFIGDALRISKDRRVGLTRFLLCLLVFLPPMTFAYFYPGVFLKALGYAGGFGETILNSVFPILVVLIIRYRLQLDTPRLLPGGRPVIFALLLFTLYAFYLQGIELLK